jgi:hypothetical protein
MTTGLVAATATYPTAGYEPQADGSCSVASASATSATTRSMCKVSSSPALALPLSASPIAVNARFARPIAMTCQMQPGGSRRTMVSMG